ncbi:AmmeMemoRadiSam system protein A [Thiohalophilus sp.]|uniref:AmmeMemoRadiSam system protein A n=1 Tax=Thiohalophilus sp. TaxID=3028392 RepID=UPI002ACDDB5C|nr:AmmeMemoRadiSam system protein A [Thiohalophilus sp.]MDZ7663283.1 AmmeMemoRadiSam system protein A [Thiohalophilus sp.]
MDDNQRRQLLAIARQSIQHGLQHSRPLTIDPCDYDESLQHPGASFVTLMLNRQLRGCIGSLQAHRPLVIDVAENAFAAAFRDPRFAPLTAAEFPYLEYHISLLNPAKAMQFKDQADLLKQLRPQVDGLILEDGEHRGTFLPSVWESLPHPEQFLQHLKLKAGLPADYWSDTLKVSRYTVEDIE